MSLPLVLLALFAPAQANSTPEAIEFFEKHVRPVLVEKCVSCHGPKVQRGGLRMDNRAAVLQGGDSGPALVPGEPDKSLLLKAVRHQGDLKMPPKEKDRLDDKAIADLSAWIKLGAPWPANEPSQPTVSSVELARKTHWSFRPVTVVPPPATQRKDWARSPLDAYILARLEAKGLTPSNPADRHTLLRRVTFDLTGLPPTPEEVEEFVHDARPDAYERVVDRLLASPAYGERWGRHWLDVARYSDTKGYVFQEERRYPYSYTYRDYVLRAFNHDLPYDRFILEQLAADRLDLGADRSALAAMGYLTLGRRFLNNVHDIIDDRIDVVTRGLMGLTVSCARCHDHKYDPVPTRDYYSLYGVFASSMEPAELPLLHEPDPAKGPTPFEAELNKRLAALETFAEQQREAMRRRAADYLLGNGENLDNRLVNRWKEYLSRQAGKPHPVLTPALAFSKAKTVDYPALAARFAANQDEPRINPLVARAFTGDPPKTLADVAKRYQALFDEVERVSEPTAEQKQIKEILYGKDSPLSIATNELPRLLPRDKRNRFMELKRQVDQWRATNPTGPLRAMVLVDARNPVQPHVLVRGNPGNRGVAVPRQFLEVLDPQRKPFTQGSGRLELAQAIASPNNPLTARVMVNRIWMHLFGAGLVRTPGDFGTRGEPPTHPELLDWLAHEFVASGWSVKAMQRQLVLSATYRQSSADNSAALAVDPENTLLWRMNRKRLELEPLRDAMLAASGQLNRGFGGPGVDITRAPYPTRRTVYAFIERQNLPGMFRVFDLASPDVSTPKRHTTTVPQQSLYLMNNPFVQEQAQALIRRLNAESLVDESVRIDRLHRWLYGRPADAEEIELGLAFVRQPMSGSLSSWEQYAQVLLLANEFAFVD